MGWFRRESPEKVVAAIVELGAPAATAKGIVDALLAAGLTAAEAKIWLFDGERSYPHDVPWEMGDQVIMLKSGSRSMIEQGKSDVVLQAAQDFAAAGEDKLPEGKPVTEWSFGDVEAGLAAARLVLDETFVTAGLAHHSMEPRSALAYWQNGKCILHGSTQSVSRTVASVAGWVGVPQSDVIIISEYTGGGFGSKIPGAQTMAIPALLSKKLNGRPVM